MRLSWRCRRALLFLGLVGRLQTQEASADAPVWDELTPSGVAIPRVQHTAILDSARGRMVVFGGHLGGYSSDDARVNVLSLASLEWSELPVTGIPPPALSSHTAIYDPVRDRMIVFGSFYIDTGYVPVLHALSFSSDPPVWSIIKAEGPVLEDQSAIYDPEGDRMIVFGGMRRLDPPSYGIEYHDETWELSLNGTPGWTLLHPSGGPPRARHGHTAIDDPIRRRMIVFGGIGEPDSADTTLSDTWALSLGATPAWTRLSTTGQPEPHFGHIAVYDGTRDRMLVWGGLGGRTCISSCAPGGVGCDRVATTELWALDLATDAWAPLPTNDPPH